MSEQSECQHERTTQREVARFDNVEAQGLSVIYRVICVDCGARVREFTHIASRP